MPDCKWFVVVESLGVVAFNSPENSARLLFQNWKRRKPYDIVSLVHAGDVVEEYTPPPPNVRTSAIGWIVLALLPLIAAIAALLAAF